MIETHESQMHNQVSREVKESEKVEVYIRLVNSKGIKVILEKVTEVAKIRDRIQQRLGIYRQDQLIFLRGQEIHDLQVVKLWDKAIIHIINRKQQGQEMVLNVIKHEPQSSNIFRECQTAVKTKAYGIWSVRQFVNQFLGKNHMFQLQKTKVIECGRFLDLAKTLAEQRIQKETQIHLILYNQKKALTTGNPQQIEQNHENLVRIVLNRSRQNSIDRKKHSRLSQSPKSQTQVHDQSDLQNISKLKTNPEFNLLLEFTQRLSKISLPTQSFLNSSSHKFIREQLEPLRFSLHQRRKFEGPKSQRDCLCDSKKKGGYMTQRESERLMAGTIGRIKSRPSFKR